MTVQGIEVNKKAVLFICVVLGIALYFYWPFSTGDVSASDTGLHSEDVSKSNNVGTDKAHGHGQGDSPSHDSAWTKKEFVAIPADIVKKQKDIEVKESTTEVEVEDQKLKIHLQEATPPATVQANGMTVLLLHGMKYTSENWKTLKTLPLIAAMGYTGLAIDLPGFGESGQPSPSLKNKAEFLTQFLKARGIARPVVVSPSMSGSYSIPYILGSSPATCIDRVSGFIPVAPTLTHVYNTEDYQSCKVPTMIVYGTKDAGIGVPSKKTLENLPNSAVKPMEGQEHACYLGDPDGWHKLLYNFLIHVGD